MGFQVMTASEGIKQVAVRTVLDVGLDPTEVFRRQFLLEIVPEIPVDLLAIQRDPLRDENDFKGRSEYITFRQNWNGSINERLFLMRSTGT